MIRVSVTFDTAVDVSGTPEFVLLFDGTETGEMKWSGGGSNRLDFAYTVVDGDVDTDGIGYSAGALTGGTITIRGSTDDAERTVTPVAMAPSHKVDGIRPAPTAEITSSGGRRHPRTRLAIRSKWM